MKYYSLKKILSKNAQYNMIFGERSNGKTYAVLEYAIDQYAKHHHQTAIIRRWQDDFKKNRATTLFDGHEKSGCIKRLTLGAWECVVYYRSAWYLARREDDEIVRDIEPFAYAFSISSMEHDKSSSYPNVTTILFDEFLTRRAYLPDEFVLFMNTLSTIIRNRADVKIFMCGNTVNQYCPYFAEMGITHVKNMKLGDIDVYTYGDSDLRVAVEYAGTSQKQKKDSDVYFAFDNPRLNMIKTGVWELDIYPHCPSKFKPADILATFFICFNGETLQAEIVDRDGVFIFIHRKTSPLKDLESDLIYSTENNPAPNWRRNILKPTTPYERKIHQLFMMDKVFYQDNEVGEIVRNYVVWCGGNLNTKK